MRTDNFKYIQAQRGLSIIELMISITIGLLILAALTSLFVSQSQSRAELDKATRMIENGRYAIELLSDNFRLAGFYGKLDPSAFALPATITDPCSSSVADITAMLPLHVGGIDASTPTSTIASSSLPCGLTSTKAGSDVLMLRRVDTTNSIAAASAVTGVPYIQVSSCNLDTPTYVLSTTPANFTRRTRGCTATSTTPYANLRRLMAQAFFVSPDDNTGDGIPTLKVAQLDPAGTGAIQITPLVEGIEYMQVEYGIDGVDTNGDSIPDRFNQGSTNPVVARDIDGTPDAYVPCSPCTIAQWANVVSLRIYIIARNIEPTLNYSDTKTYTLGQAGVFGPFNDSYKRHLYTQVIRLVNPSGRREM